MSDYIKQLEEQNEQLKKQLANSEQYNLYWRSKVTRCYEVFVDFIPMELKPISGEVCRAKQIALNAIDVFQLIEEYISFLSNRRQHDVNVISISRYNGRAFMWELRLVFNGDRYYLYFTQDFSPKHTLKQSFDKPLVKIITDIKDYANKKGWFDE